ncbi:MAG TPA: hypothetical protein VE914_21140, partial [Candidatus Angelobacter sp.]|nr:hypothetical protein [Candidatus Angelobacter sp.]
HSLWLICRQLRAAIRAINPMSSGDVRWMDGTEYPLIRAAPSKTKLRIGGMGGAGPARSRK